MKTLHDFKAEQLADSTTGAAYDEQSQEFTLTRELIAARARAGVSQSELALRMGTTQSVIARLESGKRPSSLRTVQRYAAAPGGRVELRIVEG